MESRVSSAETVTKQGCDSDGYPGGTPDDHIKNSFHQRLIEIMYEGTKGDIPTLRCKDINFVAKYVNEVNEVLKCITSKKFVWSWV